MPRRDDRRAGVQASSRAQRRRVGEVGLGQHDAVGDRDLAHRLRLPSDCAAPLTASITVTTPSSR